MELYRTLRDDLAAPDLAELKAGVAAHYDDLVLAQSRNELVAIDLADFLSTRLTARDGSPASAGSSRGGLRDPGARDSALVREDRRAVARDQ
jgi:hypothetical protein